MCKRVFSAVAAATLALALFSGCGKKAETETEATATVDEGAAAEEAAAVTAAAPPPPPPPPPGGEVLPGANSVRASLAKKDYQNAVGGLLALRGAATGERYTEYVNLYGEVIDTLRAESATDRKAAEALMTLNMARSGR